MSDPTIAGSNVSRETYDRLRRFQQLLEKWNPAINLVAKTTIEHAWERHFVDSAQIFGLAPEGASHWADLGTGGGFPGMVVAILAAEISPDLRVSLVESDRRKASFLQSVARELDLSPSIIVERIQEISPLAAGVVSARALAPLSQLLEYAERHLLPDGVAIFPKGANYRKEIDDALAMWRFDVQKIPSKTDPNAVTLRIERLFRV